MKIDMGYLTIRKDVDRIRIHSRSSTFNIGQSILSSKCYLTRSFNIIFEKTVGKPLSGLLTIKGHSHEKSLRD
jgi:hypothetical protein